MPKIKQYLKENFEIFDTNTQNLFKNSSTESLLRRSMTIENNSYQKDQILDRFLDYIQEALSAIDLIESSNLDSNFEDVKLPEIIKPLLDEIKDIFQGGDNIFDPIIKANRIYMVLFPQYQ